MRSREGCVVRVGGKDPYDRVLQLEPSQSEVLAAVLSRAFCDQPQFRYLMPDDRTRLRFLPSLFRSAIRACQWNGEIHTTRDVDGGALWIGPGRELTLARMMKAFRAVSLQWEWASLRRCMNLVVHLDEVHIQLVKGLHWYLLALEVEPSKQGGTVEGTLLEPLLARADSDGLPCYLETFDARNLPFYKRYGFRIAGGGKIPGGGPDFWAMIRKPEVREEIFSTSVLL